MAYNKTEWVNDSPPAISAGNLNKIEQGIEDAHNALDTVYDKSETYSKSEVYNKTEVYGKTEVYDKTESNAKFVTKGDFVMYSDVVTNVFAGQSASVGMPLATFLAGIDRDDITSWRQLSVISVQGGYSDSMVTKIPRMVQGSLIYPNVQIESGDLTVNVYNSSDTKRDYYFDVLLMINKDLPVWDDGDNDVE